MKQKIVCEFEIKTDRRIQAKRPDPVIVNNIPDCGLCCSGRAQSRSERN